MKNKQRIQNQQGNSSYTLTCILCGKQKNLCMTAHRNKKNAITGFLISCQECQEKLPQYCHLDNESKSTQALIKARNKKRGER